jgi:hypothetical protein
MRPMASNNELLGILGFGALIGAILVYTQTPKTPVPQPQPVVVVQEPVVVVKPAHWGLGGVGPGWGGGRWLGEGDFKHFGSMDHPFRDQPRYSGHPMHVAPLPTAPQGPRGHRDGLMMPPMGSAMGPVRY